MTTVPSTQKKLLNIIRRLSAEKLERLLQYAEILDEEITPEEAAVIENSEAEISRGEYIDFEDFCRRERL